jgi:alkylation response protein AidB-like acyl-CoA dehydrogenase
LDLLLTEQQKLFAETATRLCLDHGGPGDCGRLRAAAAEIDADAWRKIIESEWLATVVAEGRGGQGLGALDVALALEQAGHQLLMVPLLEAARRHGRCHGPRTLRAQVPGLPICCAARV